MKVGMIKNIIITVLLVIVFSTGAYLYGSGKLTSLFTPISTPAPFNQTETPLPTTSTSPDPASSVSPAPQTSAVEEIRQAMATKHNKSVSDTDISINEITANHASGVVKFAGEIAGGWFLAAKTVGDWQIVADGNGTVSCADIDPFNFPTSMVPECWDDSTQTLITR
jgi:hypothetical protein